MIEILVKWCCDIERIPYKPKQNKSLKMTDYKIKNCGAVHISSKRNDIEQMTIFDYVYEENVI